jgi:aldose 1-epimerase
MSIVNLQNTESGSSARIAVNQGFNCFQFHAHLADGRTVDVLSATEDFSSGKQRSTHYGIPLLFPFPNRIEGGRYSWDGTEYQLSPERVLFDDTGNAIHGLCLDRPWRIAEQSLDSVTGVFRLSVDAPDRLAFWPTDAEIQVSYRVLGSCLRSDIRVINPGDRPLPWGFGTHAYFNVPLSRNTKSSQCALLVPAHRIWDLVNGLPTGTKRDPNPGARLHEECSFNNLKVDDIYSEVIDESGAIVCRISDPAAGLAVEQRCSTDFRELVVFTPPWSSSVCIEPYTCVTNAINLQQRGIDAGLRVLAPGASWNGWIEIEAIAT